MPPPKSKGLSEDMYEVEEKKHMNNYEIVKWEVQAQRESCSPGTADGAVV